MDAAKREEIARNVAEPGKLRVEGPSALHPGWLRLVEQDGHDVGVIKELDGTWHFTVFLGGEPANSLEETLIQAANMLRTYRLGLLLGDKTQP
jgi:hypothetical protein